MRLKLSRTTRRNATPFILDNNLSLNYTAIFYTEVSASFSLVYYFFIRVFLDNQFLDFLVIVSVPQG